MLPGSLPNALWLGAASRQHCWRFKAVAISSLPGTVAPHHTWYTTAGGATGETLSLLLQVLQDKVKALLRLSELERVQVRALTRCLHSQCTASLTARAFAQLACTASALL